MLDDLVLGVEGTTTDDVRYITRASLLDGDSIYNLQPIISNQVPSQLFFKVLTLANISPPNVLDRARSTAVDTLSLGSTDDDVLDRSAGLQDEDSVGFASLALALAITGASSTVEPLHATVESTRDDRSGRESGVAAGGGEGGGKTSWNVAALFWWVVEHK